MRLHSLRISEFRQFRRPLVIDAFDEGINLFFGPNESGKSTLVEAIRAAFFERHKSSTVEHLQPWGDSSAAPEVEVAFDWEGARWTLCKRFLGRKRCDLSIGQERLTGDDAEDKLATLLSYSYAGRGASKPEQQGIPGLLWVQQGTIQQIDAPVEHARDYLQAALSNDLSALASSGGEDLIAEVNAEREELLTGTGRPTGEYKRFIAELADAQAKLQQATEQIAQYEARVDALDRLQAEQARIDATEPWHEQRQKAAQAEVRLKEIESLEAQQGQDKDRLAECLRQQTLYREQIKDLDTSAKQVETRAAEKAKAKATFDECSARGPQLDKVQADARAGYDGAVELWKRAREQTLRQRLQHEHQTLAETVKTDKGVLGKVTAAQERLHALDGRRQAIFIDSKRLKRLKKLETELAGLLLRKETLATRLTWAVAPGERMILGEQELTGEGRRLLVEPAKVTVPKIGTLIVEPGGTDVAELVREQMRVTGERDVLLTELGIPELAEGEARADELSRIDSDIKHERARLDGLAPDGIDQLNEQIRQNDSRLSQVAAQLRSYAPLDLDIPEERAAERQRDAAQQALERADAAVHAYKKDLALAAQALETAQGEWQRAQQAFAAPERKQREEQANKELVDLKAVEKILGSTMTARQIEIDEAQPELLRDDARRCSQSADAMEAQAREREKSIERLRTELEVLGASGLQDQRGRLEQDAVRLQRHHDELHRRAAALDLLLKLLGDKRQAIIRKLQEPLRLRLDHYLKLLFAQATVDVSENLVPTLLVRRAAAGEEQGAVIELSYGAREQIGLISRCAYADLLREAGKPTLLILDDALVHSDAQRLEQMKRILFDVSKRHQVLLFTCHPENWADIGVRSRDLRRLGLGEGMVAG